VPCWLGSVTPVTGVPPRGVDAAGHAGAPAAARGRGLSYRARSRHSPHGRAAQLDAARGASNASPAYGAHPALATGRAPGVTARVRSSVMARVPLYGYGARSRLRLRLTAAVLADPLGWHGATRVWTAPRRPLRPRFWYLTARLVCLERHPSGLARRFWPRPPTRIHAADGDPLIANLVEPQLELTAPCSSDTSAQADPDVLDLRENVRLVGLPRWGVLGTVERDGWYRELASTRRRLVGGSLCISTRCTHCPVGMAPGLAVWIPCRSSSSSPCPFAVDRGLSVPPMPHRFFPFLHLRADADLSAGPESPWRDHRPMRGT